MTAKLYGIKNCDTVKKALNWLDKHNITYQFHNYKKQGLDENAFNTAIAQHGWETVINKRGTSWRALPDTIKKTITDTTAINIAKENPSLVKRPLLILNGAAYLGFKEADYKEIFSV
jgi:Spx/MgsR family transcriptional regulator